MPLALECVCSEDSSICELVSLTLVLKIEEIFVGTPPNTVNAIHTLTVYSDQSDSGAPLLTETVDFPGVGDHAIDLPLADWLSRWATISVELITEATLLQTPDPAYSAYDLYRVTYHIDQLYECHHPVTMEVTGSATIKAITTRAEDDTSCGDVSTQAAFLCFAGAGVYSVMYRSGPAGECFGCTINDYDFKPLPDESTKVYGGDSEICLCASGGVAPYTYSILAGHLASGQTLNPTTGCIEGTADGASPASEAITFRATEDPGSGPPNTADVTCSFIGVGCMNKFGNDFY